MFPSLHFSDDKIDALAIINYTKLLNSSEQLPDSFSANNSLNETGVSIQSCTHL